VSVVIELTLRPIPGHFDRALETYANFVATLEDELDDLILVLLAADPSSNTIRGVGIYEHAEVAEGLTSLPVFAGLADALAPHLASGPERVELNLLNLFAVETELGADGINDATLVEFTMKAKLGHVAEVIDLYAAFIERYQERVPDARLVLETAHEASGTIRGIVVYDHNELADAADSSHLLGDFVDSVEHLLASPPERTELSVLHLFARG